MIDKSALIGYIESKLDGTDMYLVDVKITPDNNIIVELDSDTAIDIDDCIKLTQEIESEFDRDKEDYELEVGSVGITSPLQVPRQYKKYIGKEMEVLTKSGKKLKGILVEAGEDGFKVETEEKVRKEGTKKPVIEKISHDFNYGDVKEVKYLLKF